MALSLGRLVVLTGGKFPLPDKVRPRDCECGATLVPNDAMAPYVAQQLPLVVGLPQFQLCASWLKRLEPTVHAEEECLFWRGVR